MRSSFVSPFFLYVCFCDVDCDIYAKMTFWTLFAAGGIQFNDHYEHYNTKSFMKSFIII